LQDDRQRVRQEPGHRGEVGDPLVHRLAHDPERVEVRGDPVEQVRVAQEAEGLLAVALGDRDDGLRRLQSRADPLVHELLEVQEHRAQVLLESAFLDAGLGRRRRHERRPLPRRVELHGVHVEGRLATHHQVHPEAPV
jgi:hypothetical protein